MYEDQQAKLKMEQAQYAAQSQTLGGICGSNSMSEPARPGLRERIGDQSRRAGNEARKAERLKELEYLLDKHPEVARILDLLDDVRY